MLAMPGNPAYNFKKPRNIAGFNFLTLEFFMKVFAIAIALVTAIVATECHAEGMIDYRVKRTGLKPNLSDKEALKLYNSNKLVCVKDGGSVKRANQAFVKAGLGTRDCSQGEKTRMKHSKRGIAVLVIECYQLSGELMEKYCK